MPVLPCSQGTPPKAPQDVAPQRPSPYLRAGPQWDQWNRRQGLHRQGLSREWHPPTFLSQSSDTSSDEEHWSDDSSANARQGAIMAAGADATARRPGHEDGEVLAQQPQRERPQGAMRDGPGALNGQADWCLPQRLCVNTKQKLATDCGERAWRKCSRCTCFGAFCCSCRECAAQCVECNYACGSCCSCDEFYYDVMCWTYNDRTGLWLTPCLGSCALWFVGC